MFLSSVELVWELILEIGMPRSKANNFSLYPYHVTNRSINRDWFSMPMGEVWGVMEDYLFLTKICFGIEIHSFVLMSNHFHLLLSAPQLNLSEAMKYFHWYTSLAITKATGRINHLWAHRFKRCEVIEENHFLNCYKYIYQNPIRAGLTERVQDYSFSTLAGLIGRQRLIIPVSMDNVLFDDVDKTLEWLNARPPAEDWKAVGQALRRPKFQMARQNSKPHRLENDLL